MANTKPKGGLTAWFGKGKKGDWVDIGAPKKKRVGIKLVVVNRLRKANVHTRNAFHGLRLVV